MRAMRRTLMAAATALALAAPLSLAANHHEGGEDKDGQGGGRMAWMKEKLHLSDEQVAKVKEVHKALEAEAKAAREAVKADLEALKKLVDAKSADETLKAALDKLKADVKALDELRRKRMDSLATVLNPMQQAQAALAMARHIGQEVKEHWKDPQHRRGGKGGHDEDDDEEEDEDGKDDKGKAKK